MDRLPGMNSSLKFSPLTENQLRNLFKRYDANGDNLLSKEELKKAFEYLGSIIPSIHADRGLHHADANNDGYVNEGEMDELVKYAMRVGFTVKDADPSSSVMPRRDGHDKYYGDTFTEADANNANGDGLTTSFGFLTKEQLMEKFKQCDVNNVRQLSRAELKKRFQYFNKGELNKLVEHAPKLGFTVEP
ncbi:calmodulin-like protein 6 isoform X2 [Quercus robur]|uniref:calmodulin-like protein 6 isoform X2 n=1 Tax=Quercus robur TaxID=38942 RepID=UPI002161E35D|nr:calmodulin-like protein 6 isoform X2 [Quercus robur]